MNDVIREKLEKENLDDDNVLQQLIYCNDLNDEEKVYLFKNYKDNILKMNREKLLFALMVININLCEKLDFFLSEFLPSLPLEQIESLIYLNKYERKFSDIVSYLYKQPWFLEKKYDIIRFAVSLENSIKDDRRNIEHLREKGNLILDSLSNSDDNLVFFDMILKNYLALLQSKDTKYLEIFIQKSYSIIFEHLDDSREFTNNELIFLSRDASRNLKLDLFNFCEFSTYDNDTFLANADEDSINISLLNKKNLYNTLKNNKISNLYLIFTIGHELFHHLSRCYSIHYEEQREDSSLDKLMMYLSSVGDAIFTFYSDLYNERHDSFSNEYLADINGIKYLYYIIKRYTNLDNNLKEIITGLILYTSSSSYKYDEEKGRYITPIEFTKELFEKAKPFPPGYTKYILYHQKDEMPDDLRERETKLTEEEKFTLGYPNKYIDLFFEIANGRIKCANLFEDLPYLYDVYMNDKKENTENKRHGSS